MQYLHLSREEFRELRNLHWKKIPVYAIMFVAIVSFSYIVSVRFTSHLYDGVLPYWISGAIAFAFIGYVYYMNQRYLKDLIKKEKRVYKGILSKKVVSRRSKRERYFISMDGMIFETDLSNFNTLEEGDLIEIHISPEIRHLFKVSKSSV